MLRDSIAVDKGEILWAATSENIDRRDFDVLEEAKAVELMVSEFGSADVAAKKLGRSKGWVSQRRALLKLAPELQAALRAGDLAVRQARSLARVPLEEQVAAWEAAQNLIRNPKPTQRLPSLRRRSRKSLRASSSRWTRWLRHSSVWERIRMCWPRRCGSTSLTTSVASSSMHSSSGNRDPKPIALLHSSFHYSALRSDVLGIWARLGRVTRACPVNR